MLGISAKLIPPHDVKNTNETVYGNGGTSVTKGDYVYFVNSYTSYNGLEKNDNNTGEVTNSAIYRTKLSGGKVNYDDNGNVKYEAINTEGFTLAETWMTEWTPDLMKQA